MKGFRLREVLLHLSHWMVSDYSTDKEIQCLLKRAVPRDNFSRSFLNGRYELLIVFFSGMSQPLALFHAASCLLLLGIGKMNWWSLYLNRCRLQQDSMIHGDRSTEAEGDLEEKENYQERSNCFLSCRRDMRIWYTQVIGNTCWQDSVIKAYVLSRQRRHHSWTRERACQSSGPSV